MAGAAYALGWAEREGWLDRLPALGGIPRVGIAGAVALVGATMTSGRAAEMLDGIADAAIAVSLHGLATGGVSGASDDDLAAMERELASLGTGDDVSGIEDVIHDEAMAE